MSDELDRLSRAFKQQDINLPRKEVRNAAVHTAMRQFDSENFEENFEPTQGKAIGERPRERGNKKLSALNWRKLMNFIQPKQPVMNFKHLLAGGASVAVLAFAVVNIDQLMPGSGFDKVDLPATLQEAKKDGDDERTASSRDIVNGIAKQKPATSEDVHAGGKSAPRTKLLPGGAASGVLKEEVASALVDRTTREAEAPLAVTRPQPKKNAVGKLRSDGRQRTRMNFAPANEVTGFAAPAPESMLNPQDRPVPGYQDKGRDKFETVAPNPTKVAREEPVSTFSVDVDTASYSFIRSALNRGVLPQMDAVRIEEMINYFNYKYQLPQDRSVPFKANVSIMPTPWNSNTKLMRIGIKGYKVAKSQAPHANLVFLIDTSGSMNAPDKLPLLRNSFKLLLQSLKADDTVAIVTYAGSAGTVLEPTKASDKNKIMAALDRLSSGGSTAGAAGIRQAYQLAEQHMEKSGVNRVILATDGDFNVGISNTEELKSFVARKRKTGVTLSVLGFGHGNYNDQLMQTLAQNGNGNAAYIDTLSEARKVLVEEAGSTLFTIAKDVKLQMEFNPEMVAEYRLIGYETRQLKREDFNNDKVDAGDIGAGHTVTALYEIRPTGVSGRLVDELRYQVKETSEGRKVRGNSSEYAFMKIRYKLPNSNTSQLITVPITKAMELASNNVAPNDMRFAAAVAAFGQILRGGRNTGSYTYDDVISLALSGKGEDQFGYRAEFINLVRLAKTAAAMQ